MSSTSNMGVSQTPEQAEQASHTFLPNNSFVPPKGGVCLINNLPPELLSYLFKFGSADDSIIGNEDEDTRYNHIDAEMANEKDTHDHRDHQTMDDEKEGKGAFAESKSSNVSLPFTFVISHVCRHWRNIALLTPSFWTTIAITLKARPPYERVSTQLEWSKSLPIDITVNCELGGCDNLSKPPSPADFKFLLAMLVPHTHRWRTMEVRVSSGQYMQEFLRAVSGPSVPAASQLMTLELYDDLEDTYDGFPYVPLSKHLILFSGSAPLLTKIVLWGVYVDWDQPWIASASNLTDLVLTYHLEAARPSLAQFSAILRNNPALEKFYLRQSGPSWFIGPPSPVDFDAPTQLARLVDINLAFDVQMCATWFMRNFTFPALRNLVLDPEDGDYTEFVEELARPTTSLSASRASCSSLSGLESLKIVRLRCSDESIKTLYGELQNLRSLNLSLFYLDPLFLDILCTPCTLPGHGNIWLPRLVTLYIAGMSVRTLREFVSKRMEAGVPLSALFVGEASAMYDEDMEWFEQNVNVFWSFKASD